MPSVKTITANGVTYGIDNGLVTVNGSFSWLPYTISDAAITSDMVVLESYFNNPSALLTDVSWATANGSVTLNGTSNGTTTVKLVLGKIL